MISTIIITLVFVYISLTILYKIAQLVYGAIYHSNYKDTYDTISVINQNEISPTCAIIYPIYNESKAVMQKVFDSSSEVYNYNKYISIVFVDDGSENQAEIQDCFNNSFALEDRMGSRVQLLRKENSGKREAQMYGLERVKAGTKYIITVDSDTIINSESVCRLINTMEVSQSKGEHIGATTGNALVSNSTDNLLTLLISLRYYLAFNLERASQSVNKSVLCCTGVFTIYRKSFLDYVKQDYLSQTFLGTKCTYGDDRHLTNLVFQNDLNVIYDREATCTTHVPNTLGGYIRQQIRWNKSFFREFLVSLKSINKMSFYSACCLIAQPLMLFLFPFSLANAIYLISTNVLYAFYYLFLIVLMSLIGAFYAIVLSRNFDFLLFPIYGLLHLFILFPVKLESLLTLKDNDWMTRDKTEVIWITTFLWMLVTGLTVFLISLFI